MVQDSNVRVSYKNLRSKHRRTRFELRIVKEVDK